VVRSSPSARQGERRTRTRFQIYLNKQVLLQAVSIRKPASRAAVAASGSWDEPAYADDFLALAFFGRLAREALGGQRTPVVFRADISRPQYQRDCLDGLLDVNVCGNYAGYAAAWTGGGSASARPCGPTAA